MKSPQLALDPGSPLANQHVKRVLDDLMEGCQLIGPDYRYLYVNIAAARHGKTTPENLTGRLMADVYPGIEGSEMFAALQRCMEQRVHVEMENEFAYADGSTGWFELRMDPVPDGVFILSVDASERHRSDVALRDLAKRYSRILDASFDAISVSQDGFIREANPGFARLFGYATVDEVIGRAALDFVAPESRDEARRRISANVDGVYDLVGQRRDGQRIFLEATSRTDVIDGRPARIGAVRDMTQQRVLERQYRQAQKMEAVGRLAGGVAHDFNNLLTVIIGHADLLLDEVDATSAESVREIRGAARTAAELTAQLLAFSRQQVIEKTPVPIDEAVSSSERLLTRLIGADIDFAIRLDAKDTFVPIDRHQLEQIIINLAVNARDAMPTGGKLTIETTLVELDDETARTHWQIEPGPYVILSISDTGTGMDAAVQDQIFEPFFTTKEQGRGTGLGLSIAYGVVKQVGGAIAVYSEVGSGTVFKIYLPVTGGGVAAPNAAPRLRVVRGSETILVVEDSRQVRDIARRVLSQQGYSVLVASTPTEAMGMMESGSGIQLLLTDLVLPGMSGRELATRFSELHPAARVVYMSGYTDDAALRHGISTAGIPYLQKPFTPDGLARIIRDVLDKESTAPVGTK